MRISKNNKFKIWAMQNKKSSHYILTDSDLEVIRKQGLNTTDILLLAIINSSDGNGTCFINDQTFSEKLKKSKSMIQNSMTKLRKAGLIRTYTKDKHRYVEAVKYDPYREHRPFTDEEWKQMESQAELFEEPPEDFEEGGLVETA